MYGFTIIYNNSTLFSLIGNEIIEFTSKRTELQMSFCYSFFSKFKEDKIFKESEEYVIGIDGVILNLKQLKNSYGISDFFKLIINLWKTSKEGLANHLKGEFSGFIFEKKSERLFMFSNQTATKPQYYSDCCGSVIVSNTISNIVSYRNEIGLASNLNKDAVYSMFTYGAMFEKETLVVQVERLHAGEFITIDESKLFIGAYQNFNDVSVSIGRKKQAIDLLEESFLTALHLEYQKDLEYNYNHLATLSGGLDSRMNVMLASKFGYKNDVFCFSESGYLDEEISKDIAQQLDLNYQFIPLDGGGYFKSLSENTEIVRGTAFYLGSAHLNFALAEIDIHNYGLIHTGQIGDGILGGFVSKNSENYFSKTISSKFKHKAIRDSSVLDKYSSEETFKLINRVCNLTNSGSFTIEHHQSYLVSPFMDVDFINNCLSIDPSLKKNGKLYLEWINLYHSELSKFKWERTGFTPTQIWKTRLSRYTKKAKLEYYKILKKENRLSMNPLEFWYRNNQELQLFYENYFDAKIDSITNEELKIDFREMFKGNVIERSMVLTILEFIYKNKILV